MIYVKVYNSPVVLQGRGESDGCGGESVVSGERGGVFGGSLKTRGEVSRGRGGEFCVERCIGDGGGGV